MMSQINHFQDDESPFLAIRKQFKLYRDYIRWEFRGKTGPAPHLKKRQVVRQFAKEFRTSVFVETGTFRGDMVAAVEPLFESMHTIELAPHFYWDAVKRFRNCPKVQLHLGDSGELLPFLANEIDRPCLFWLDGHYSGGQTACGELETPVMKELETIFRHKDLEHVILIDDAREFIGKHDYPTLEFVQDFVRQQGRYQFDVKNDIIRIVPDRARSAMMLDRHRAA